MVSFKNKTFIDEKFSDDDLQGAVFEQCRFYCCDFSRSDLTDAQFLDCKFIEQGDSKGCRFEYSVLNDASFKQCDLSMALFRGAQCFGIEFRDCQLRGSDFCAASFANFITQKTYFCSAFITGCNLSYANFENIALEKCELFENKWHGANLAGVSFKESDLSRGEFSADAWRGCDFTGTNLCHVDLTGLDLRITELTDVTICHWQQEQLLQTFAITVLPD